MAFGAGTFQNIGAAASDLFSADALRTKAHGSRAEADLYQRSKRLALDNAAFTETSTRIKTYQANRKLEATLGQQQADIAANGFGLSGSSLDLMRDSAAQGALEQSVLTQQGKMEEIGFREQAQSFQIMSDAAVMAAAADEHAATGATWAAGLHAAAAIGSFIPTPTPTPGPTGG